MTGQPFKPGSAFKNGKLYLFTLHNVTVMRPWPSPLAWRKSRTRPWRMIRPSLDLPLLESQDRLLPEDGAAAPDWAVRLQKVISGFRELIPLEVREAIAPFRWRRWHLLALAARCPGALDLIRSNQGLAFCVASHWAFRQPTASRPMRTARRLVRLKQREILAWLGFPGTGWAVRMLRKIRPPDASIGLMFNIRRALMDHAAVARLAHLPRLTSDIIGIAANDQLRRAASQRLMLELCEDSPFPVYPSPDSSCSTGCRWVVLACQSHGPSVRWRN